VDDHERAKAITREMVEKLRKELLAEGMTEEAEELDRAAGTKLSPSDDVKKKRSR
jgi:hypothetical protein